MKSTVSSAEALVSLCSLRLRVRENGDHAARFFLSQEKVRLTIGLQCFALNLVPFMVVPYFPALVTISVCLVCDLNKIPTYASVKGAAYPVH
jgi:hypothetical protein